MNTAQIYCPVTLSDGFFEMTLDEREKPYIDHIRYLLRPGLSETGILGLCEM